MQVGPKGDREPGRATGHGEERELSAQILSASWFETEDLAAPADWQVGRYAVLRPLGRGGSSEVLLAEDPLMGRQVAIKVLRADVKVGAERFQQEIKVLASLEHSSIVQIYDAGVTDDGRPFFVMEYVGDRTLEGAELDLRAFVRVLATVARTCHWAHERGVVHRDLKPANVLLGEAPKVADFGVAKLLQPSGPALSSKGALVGTLAYMAPEQINNEGVGPATDVHALGAVLYERLAGRTPYPAGNPLHVLAKIAKGDPTPPSELRGDVPPELEVVALTALATDPAARQASVAAFARELERWLGGAGASTRPERPPLALLAVAGLAVLGLGLGALLVLAAGPPEPGPEPAAGAELGRASPPLPPAGASGGDAAPAQPPPESGEGGAPDPTIDPTPEAQRAGPATARAADALASAQRRASPRTAGEALAAALEAVRAEPGTASSRAFGETWRWFARATTGLDPTRRMRAPPPALVGALEDACAHWTEQASARALDHAGEVARATAVYVRWLRLGRAPDDLDFAASELERLCEQPEASLEAHLSLATLRVTLAVGSSGRTAERARARAALERARLLAPDHPEVAALDQRLR
jgi:serine/threonine-protein kinase